MSKRLLVVGAGLSGAVAARLHLDAGWDVEVLETQLHTGGLCHDRLDDRTGLRVHTFGPHVLHTDDAEVWKFLGQFSNLRRYEHKVLANTRIGRIPVPFNLTAARKFYAHYGRPAGPRDILDLIFRGYSSKQWGMDFEQLPPAITSRVPKLRENEDDRYFTSEFQGLPDDEGYAGIFSRLLSGAEVRHGVPADLWRAVWRGGYFDRLVYTGRLDLFFGLQVLNYRGVRIVHSHSRRKLPAVTVNECQAEIPFTRRTDNRFFSTDVDVDTTVITTEYPGVGAGYLECYPQNWGADQEAANCLLKQVDQLPNIFLLGRMARYRYMDMDTTIHEVLSTFADTEI